MKHWRDIMTYLGIFIAVVSALGIAIAGLVTRIQHPELTETQLFLELLVPTLIAIGGMGIGYVLVECGKS